MLELWNVFRKPTKVIKGIEQQHYEKARTL